MKKMTAMLLAGVMCLGVLTACGGGDTAQTPAPAQSAAPVQSAAPTEPTPETKELKTVNPGKLTVATSPDFAPYEFYAIADDGTPTLAGFDMALAQYVADYLGLELDVVPMDLDGVIMEIQT